MTITNRKCVGMWFSCFFHPFIVINRCFFSAVENSRIDSFVRNQMKELMNTNAYSFAGVTFSEMDFRFGWWTHTEHLDIKQGKWCDVLCCVKTIQMVSGTDNRRLSNHFWFISNDYIVQELYTCNTKSNLTVCTRCNALTRTSYTCLANVFFCDHSALFLYETFSSSTRCSDNWCCWWFPPPLCCC